MFLSAAVTALFAGAPALALASDGGPELLEPGPVRLSKASDYWRDSGLLRFASKPEKDPERWVISGERFSVQALVVKGPGPAVVFLPHLMGGPQLSEYVARRVTRAGLQVVALLPPRNLDREPEKLADSLAARIRGARAALRIADQELRPGCRVLAGISLGGIVGITTAAIEDHVTGVVPILAGGDLPWLLEHSEEELLRGMRSETVDPDSLRFVDPLTWAARLNPDRVMLLNARWDRVVPREAADRLWDGLRNPERHFFPSGHYSFRVFLPAAMDLVIDRTLAWCGEDAEHH